jgi:hypothetical protein
MNKSNIELNEVILADKAIRGGAMLFVGRIVEVREKAVKVDYAIEGISGYSSAVSFTVYSYSVWVPKSVILHDERGTLTLKKWFLNTGLKGAHHIKKYLLNDKGEKAFV